MAKTTAAVVAITAISSSWGTLRGMMTIATATARPSRKYLTARVRSSVPLKRPFVLILRARKKIAGESVKF